MRKLICILCSLLLVGCASGSKGNNAGWVNDGYSNSMMPEVSYVEEDFDSMFNDYKGETNQTSSTNKLERKLIKTYNYSIETENYDNVLKGIKESVNRLGGYIQNSDNSGYSYYYKNNRNSSYTIRIPSNACEEFSSSLNEFENSVVISSSENVNDITSSYFDTQAHINNLKIEEETLQKLMEKADNMSDIILIEERLSNLRYEIESYETTIKNYDTLVDYSTFYIYISEVTRVEYVEPTFAQRVQNEFLDSLEAIGDFFTNLAIFLIGDIIYIVIFGGLVLGTIKFLKKKNIFQKKEKKIVDKSE